MHMQLMVFDGPRDADQVEASRRAGRDRIGPLVDAHPDLRGRVVGFLRAVAPDGAECVLAVTRDADALEEMGRVISASELLPGEDPALLTGPDRVTRYEVTDGLGAFAQLWAVAP